MKTTKVCRENLPAGACLCDYCTGKCCRYFSLPFPTPTTREDFETVRGYLEHGQTVVYVEKGTWYLVVLTRCKYLTDDNRCAVYFNRPKICKEYTTAECEFDTDWLFEKVFETPEQWCEYADSVLPRRNGSPGLEPSAPNVPATFVLPLETPTTWDDFDAIRWYLAHGQTFVFVDDGTWHLEVSSRRGAPAGRACAYDQVFETAEQLWEYAEAVLPPRRRARGGGPALPLITLG